MFGWIKQLRTRISNYISRGEVRDSYPQEEILFLDLNESGGKYSEFVKGGEKNSSSSSSFDDSLNDN